MSCPFKRIENKIQYKRGIAADDLEPNIQYIDDELELKEKYEVCSLKSPITSINIDLTINESALCKGKCKCPYFDKDGKVKGW